MADSADSADSDIRKYASTNDWLSMQVFLKGDKGGLIWKNPKTVQSENKIQTAKIPNSLLATAAASSPLTSKSTYTLLLKHYAQHVDDVQNVENFKIIARIRRKKLRGFWGNLGDAFLESACPSASTADLMQLILNFIALGVSIAAAAVTSVLFVTTFLGLGILIFANYKKNEAASDTDHMLEMAKLCLAHYSYLVKHGTEGDLALLKEDIELLDNFQNQTNKIKKKDRIYLALSSLGIFMCTYGGIIGLATIMAILFSVSLAAWPMGIVAVAGLLLATTFAFYQFIRAKKAYAVVLEKRDEFSKTLSKLHALESKEDASQSNSNIWQEGSEVLFKDIHPFIEQQDVNGLRNFLKTNDIEYLQRNPLHLAAQVGNVEILRLLLNNLSEEKKKGWLIEKESKTNKIPLMIAAQNSPLGVTSVYTLLLKQQMKYKDEVYDAEVMNEVCRLRQKKAKHSFLPSLAEAAFQSICPAASLADLFELVLITIATIAEIALASALLVLSGVGLSMLTFAAYQRIKEEKEITARLEDAYLYLANPQLFNDELKKSFAQAEMNFRNFEKKEKFYRGIELAGTALCVYGGILGLATAIFAMAPLILAAVGSTIALSAFAGPFWGVIAVVGLGIAIAIGLTQFFRYEKPNDPIVNKRNSFFSLNKQIQSQNEICQEIPLRPS